jgi:hypothetical protein
MGYKDPVFYLVARSFTQTSAGIRAIHILCDQLNTFGFNSFLIGIDRPLLLNSNLNTPILSEEMRDSHFESGRKVISIYDESVSENPIKGDISVRWLLNRGGFLAGKNRLGKSREDLKFVYAKEIDFQSPRLFVNTVDYKFYREHNRDEIRNIELFYSGKIKALGQKIEKPNDSIEIFRSGLKKQTREDLRMLFSKARVLYLAEDSALALEAAICGCPTVHIKDYFRSPPLSQEDGGVGLAKDDNPESLAAVNLEKDSIERYMATLELRTFNDVIKFALLTQASSKSILIQKKARYNFPIAAKYIMQINKAMAGFRYSGLRGLFGVFFSHISFKKNGS